YEGVAGDTARLRAFVLDLKGRRFVVEDLEWDSADSTVAVVDEGRLYLVQPGETQLSVDYKGTKLTASARASNKVTISKVDIFPEPLSLTVDEEQQLGLYIRYSDGNSVENTLGANWSSSDPSVASVSGTGTVMGLKTGKTNVIGRRGKYTDTNELTVVAASESKPAATLSIAPDTGQVEVGKTYTFATALSTGEKSPEGVTWTLEDPTVASVDTAGELTGKRSGLTTVRAAYNGKSVSAALRVLPAPVEAVEPPAESDSSTTEPEDPPAAYIPPASGDVRLPELPREFLDTRYVAPSGRTITVGNGGDLQAALNDARDGDEVVLSAGAVFKGNFTLPRR